MGTIIQSTPDTSLNLKLIQNHSFDETLMIINDNFITVYTHDWMDNGPAILVDTIDLSGQLINATDTLFSLLGNLDWENSWRQNNHLMYIEEDEEKFYWMDYYTKQPWSLDSTRANINIYHENSTEIIEINFLDKHRVQTFSIIYVDSGRILLKLFYPDDTISYILIDQDGSMLWKVDLEGEGIRFIQLDDLNDFVLVRGGDDINGKSQIEIIKFEDGNLEKKGQIILDNEDYYMFPYGIQSIGDNNYLITVEYREDVEPFPRQGSFRTILKVDGKQIGIGTSVSTDDTSDKATNIKVIPNPFRDYFSFYSENQEGIMNLYSYVGNLILSKEIVKGYNSTTTSELNKGIYYLSLQYEGYKITKAIHKI